MSFSLVPLLLVSLRPTFLAMRRMGPLMPGMYWIQSVGRFSILASSSWPGACVFSSFSVVVVVVVEVVGDGGGSVGCCCGGCC